MACLLVRFPELGKPVLAGLIRVSNAHGCDLLLSEGK
jgi:hypothetical protein